MSRGKVNPWTKMVVGLNIGGLLLIDVESEAGRNKLVCLLYYQSCKLGTHYKTKATGYGYDIRVTRVK